VDSGYRFILKNDPFSDTVVSTSFKALTAPGRARTANLQFRRLSLYPVELRVLSIADMDHRTEQGFGKAKIRGLVEQPASGKVIQKIVPGLELALPMRLPVRGSDQKFRFICLMSNTLIFEKASPFRAQSQNSPPARPRSKVHSFRRRGNGSRQLSSAPPLFCFVNAIGNHRYRRQHPRQPQHLQRHQYRVQVRRPRQP
jgi:hypothetical protein